VFLPSLLFLCLGPDLTPSAGLLSGCSVDTWKCFWKGQKRFEGCRVDGPYSISLWSYWRGQYRLIISKHVLNLFSPTGHSCLYTEWIPPSLFPSLPPGNPDEHHGEEPGHRRGDSPECRGGANPPGPRMESSVWSPDAENERDGGGVSSIHWVGMACKVGVSVCIVSQRGSWGRRSSPSEKIPQNGWIQETEVETEERPSSYSCWRCGCGYNRGGWRSFVSQGQVISESYGVKAHLHLHVVFSFLVPCYLI